MLTFDFKKINLPPGSKVLDVGCGEGRHIFGILNEFENVYCYGLDPVSYTHLTLPTKRIV